MFSLQIVDTDAFLEMPLSTQALYFHLSMRADDDGFIDSPKKIMKIIGAQEDDLKVLLTKRFILVFESGIIVIKHWRINNYIQKDRYQETVYLDEKELISVKKNKSYTECVQVGNADKIRLDKISIDKVSIGVNPQNNNKWQDEALEAVNHFKDGEDLKSRIFKCFKDNSHKAKIAFLDCKELERNKTMYFFAVYNKLNKPE